MTTEEIEKAVSDYSKSLEPIAFENLKGEEMPYLLRGVYKEGIEFANKHWQEKTRWIPVEKKLPEVRDTPYCIAVKWEDFEHQEERVGTMYIYTDEDIGYISLTCKYWKEIE